MEKSQLPTQAEIKQLLHYDPVTGVFRWRFARTSRIKPWDVAGSLNANGYTYINWSKKLMLAHRMAWVYMTGEWPKQHIDHIDGNPANNSLVNLREATNKQNHENQSLRTDNTSGFRGVSWSKQKKKWKAYITHNKKQIYAGFFSTPQEASIAAKAKRQEIFTHDTGRDSYCKPDK